MQRDLLGIWHAMGIANGVPLRSKHSSLELAIRESDNRINELCGKHITTLIRRDAVGKKLPSPKARMFARFLNIAVPPGASAGEVSSKISQVLALKKARK